jgi:hypothetical protein
MNGDPSNFAPAFTLRSAIASVFAMLATAVLINYVHVVLVAHSPGEHALIIPGLWVFLGILGVAALFHRLFRLRILSRPELLCVLYSILLSGPMMSQGFWHRVVSISSTIPRTGDFTKIDAFSEKFWPAGENLLSGQVLRAENTELTLLGDVRFETMDHTGVTSGDVLALVNASPGSTAAVRFTLPVKSEAADGVMPGTPYLVSVLLRPEHLDADSHYYVRFYPDSSDNMQEALYSRVVRKPTVVHPEGFQREGIYGFNIPGETETALHMEIGLEGTGTLYVADPQLRSVLAMEQLFTGRREISHSDFDALPENRRFGMAVKPDHLFSVAGLRYLLGGYIPWEAWWRPMLAWGGMLSLILLGTLSIAVVMRRKWIDSERFSMPLTRIPTMLIGDDDASGGPFLSTFWRNRVLWMGFAFGFVWCLLKVMSFYNPAMPNPGIEVPLSSYFGPEWGETWNITFSVMAVFVSLAIFVELNVLISCVVGFFMYRMLYAYGYVSGLDASPSFPYAQEQQVGAYLSYAALILWFSRRYLREVLKEAVSAHPPKREEIFSCRTALILLVSVFIGSAIWANWVEISIMGMWVFMAFLLTIGLVAMRIRAECGIPFGYFTPNNAALIILLTGGISSFGPQLVVFTFVASFFITVAVFFLIPGAQLEFLELGRRYGVNPKHILYTCLLAIAGGILLGGWSFLSMSYALGGDSLRYAWAYDAKPWYFNNLNQELSQASFALTGDALETGKGMAQATYGYLYGAGIVGILTVLRQLFAGFWLHPIGFMLGSTHVMGSGGGALWGSFLTAWFIRLTVVKLGGAETVRSKLLPFFAGVFLASVLTLLLNVLYAAYLRSQGVELIFNNLL